MEYYTENLSDFGAQERKILADLLAEPWPENFNGGGGVKAAFNRYSGFVFLLNDDYQILMLNGDRAEVFLTTPYEGIEGFLEDIINEYSPSELQSDDVEFLRYEINNFPYDLVIPDAWNLAVSDEEISE